MNETPVIISGFIIGRYVSFITPDLSLLSIFSSPIAAAVPITVAAIAAVNATTRVVNRASITAASLNS